MTGPTIARVNGVSKRFVLRKETSIKERVLHPRNRGEEFWALRDVSADIPAGSTVGLVGPNGSGKSTLLKVIGAIVQPTSGTVERRGRLAPLLELGAGFHPDLTGRENVYLNAALLGVSRHETDRNFDAIVDFSGIEDFIDTQVKFYSSGMYVRLAFAVAVHVDPDLLLVDEVLAVGDEPFQLKCMDKIRSFQHEGRTIALVWRRGTPVEPALKAVAAHMQNFASTSGKPIEAGLYVFNGDSARLAIPFGPFKADAFENWADSFSNPPGNTPLGNALSVAGDAVLKSPLPRKHILVITDGMNTAGPPPGSTFPLLLRRAKDQHSDLGVHFVAFDVKASVFENLKPSMETSAWPIFTSFDGAGGLLSPCLSIKKSTLAAMRHVMENTIRNFAFAAVFIGRKRLLKEGRRGGEGLTHKSQRLGV